jgi:DNA-binding MarR family transcriptional regulator
MERAEASSIFLTNHARVLIAIARRPDALQRDIASEVGITQRAVQTIVNDLQSGGYLTRTRTGRRNHYTLIQRSDDGLTTRLLQLLSTHPSA